MGAKLSCLVNGIYVGDYNAYEAPLPARPLSQQQLSQRQSTPYQPLQLEYSNEHGEEVPRYRRQCSQLPRPQLQSLPLCVANAHREENTSRYRGEIAQPQPQRGRCAMLRLEDEAEDGGDVSGFPRRYSHPQRLRRQTLSLEHEYDPDILRYARHARQRQPAQREDEIEAVPPPVYEDQLLAGREDHSLQGSQDGSEDVPPRYEEHVYDRRIDDDDDR